MSDCTHNCESCSHNCGGKCGKIEKLELNKKSKIKKIIGISSGKGGVGKTFVTVAIASMLQKKGYKCGILDADILGPSVPNALGINDNGILADDDNNMIPKVSKSGIKVMSSNFLLDDKTTPIVYRGSLITGVLQQFYKDTMWGELDYLFIDMPPGTGDVPLTCYQMIPVDKVIIVTSPQNLVSMIVSKSVNMAEMMNIDVLGLVENMSYVICPDCKKHINIFGKSDIDEYIKEKNINVLAKIPLNSEYVKMVDNGEIENLDIVELNDVVEKICKEGLT